jgi:hypothetical protein
MNEIESAKAPHSALFVWKTIIQAVSPAIQIAAPIADITTSKDEMIISCHQLVSVLTSDILTSSDLLLLFIRVPLEGFPEKPHCIDCP